MGWSIHPSPCHLAVTNLCDHLPSPDNIPSVWVWPFLHAQSSEQADVWKPAPSLLTPPQIQKCVLKGASPEPPSRIRELLGVTSPKERKPDP